MLKPTGKYVIVEPQEHVSKTDSGLWVPEQKNKKVGYGEVIAVGKDVKELEAGDKVLYELGYTIHITDGAVQYHLTEEPYVLAKENRNELD